MRVSSVTQLENGYIFRPPAGGKYYPLVRLLREYERVERVILNRQAIINAVGAVVDMPSTKASLEDGKLRLAVIGQSLDQTILSAADSIRREGREV